MNNFSPDYTRALLQGLPHLILAMCLSLILSACGVDKEDEQRWKNSGWKTGVLSPSVLITEDHGRDVRVSFANNERVITRTTAGDASIRNAKTGEIIEYITGPFDGLSYKMISLSISPDRKSVLFWPRRKTRQSSRINSPIWRNLNDGKSQDTFQTSNKWISRALFSPNGETITTITEDESITVWDSKTGDKVLNAQGNRARYTPENHRLITVSGRAGRLETQIWNINSGRPIPMDIGNQRVIFSPDYSRVYSSSLIKEKIGQSGRTKEYEEIYIHNALTGDLIKSQKFRPRSFDDIMFSPDGRLIALSKLSAFASTIEVWDLETKKPDISLEIEASYGGAFRSRKATFSPNGQSIIASSGKSVRIWDVETGKLIKEFKHHIKPASSFEFSSDGARLLVQSRWDVGGLFSTHYTLWDIENYTFLAKFPSKSKRADAGQFSPEGDRIVTLRDKNADIWDSQTGHRIATLKGHHGKVISVEFSPDGKRVITGGRDRKAIIWDLNQ